MSQYLGDSGDRMLSEFHWSRWARATCDRHEHYLDSCAAKHRIYAMEFSMDVHMLVIKLRWHCNAGTIMVGKQCFWSRINLWVSKRSIASMILLQVLEATGCGYEIDCQTGGVWVVHWSDGMTMQFSRDKGMTSGMPYIDMTAPKHMYCFPTLGLCRPTTDIHVNMAFIQILINQGVFLQQPWQLKDGKLTQHNVTRSNEKDADRMALVLTVHHSYEGFTKKVVKRQP